MQKYTANTSLIYRLVVLTGASRGLGRALAEQCLTQGVALITLNRSHVDELDQLASTHNVPLTQILVDLNDRVAVEQATKQVVERLSQVQRPRSDDSRNSTIASLWVLRCSFSACFHTIAICALS